jgi:uncharacterized protein
MHRISSWLILETASKPLCEPCAQQLIKAFLLVAALYVSSYACATGAAPFLSGLASAPNTVPAATEKIVPHIALLLPLKSAAFKQAAEAVQRGFLAAASNQPQSLPVRIYGCVDESNDIAALYQFALANGALAMAGPLTRNGVTALANSHSITVPTLALNAAETRSAGNLFFFGLSAEAEARQVAQLAATARLRHAIIVSTNTPLSQRLAHAFAEEWRTTGGNVIIEIPYSDDPAALTSLPVEGSNMVFLAADAAKAHLIRPYLDPALPVYATSQLFNGNADTLTNFDLKEVRFVDMPWLLQPDHPAVMIYPRADPPLEPDMERLYALGIDAFRLLQMLLNNTYRSALPLDGVTGRIQLGNDQHFQRTATPALFKQGLGLTPEAAAALSAARAVSGVPASPAPAADSQPHEQ